MSRGNRDRGTGSSRLRAGWLVPAALSVLIGCASSAPRAEAPTSPGVGGTHEIEAGCAMCIYQMPGIEECVLAVDWNGRRYLVDGSGIDDHGDAHAADGLCLAARPGTMRVEAVTDNRVRVAAMQLVPQAEEAE